MDGSRCTALYQIPFNFFFNDTATTEIYTLSLHDALPIYRFRVPYMARMIKVTLPLENMPAFSWETFALVEGEAKEIGRAHV